MGFVVWCYIQKAAAGEAHHVGIADVVLRQQHERVKLPESRVLLLRCAVENSEVDFQRHADDGLNALLHHGVGKFECAEQVARVGNGDCGHVVLGCQRCHLLHLNRSFRERVSGVDAEVDELGWVWHFVYFSLPLVGRVGEGVGRFQPFCAEQMIDRRSDSHPGPPHKGEERFESI